ncbi:hypothetical protein EIP91_002717 [Steccherinum ochraceum]|uniref:Cytochrome b561 domain-containing protein n=1 Tax=Steccherinum ochraceum TaxID=92696 RepID=A0A4R0RNI3_9APHY|nr:hypothetical protein EIP91_002717 [Steccherinum ochraceum]
MASLPLPLVPPIVADADEATASATEEERQPLVESENPPDIPTTDRPAIEEMGYKDSYEKPEEREGDAAAQVAAIASVGVFVAAVWIMALSSPSSFGLFTWHPLCQSLSLALFTYGVLTLQSTSRPKTKTAGLVRHQLAMIALGIPVAVIGTSIVVYNKSRHNKEHFTTWHGTFGITVMCLSILQVLLGGGSVWFDGRAFGGNPRAKLVWKYHRLSGYIIYPLYLFTAYLGGAWSHWAQERSVLVVRLFAFNIAPAVLLLAILSRVRLSKMKFF